MQERRQAAWIGGSVWITGNVVSKGDLIIDGKVEGHIELPDHSLSIGESATVVADLIARTVTISGNVTGNVTGTGKVELKKSAIVDGDISAPRIAMEEGAVLSGKVEMPK